MESETGDPRLVGGSRPGRDAVLGFVIAAATIFTLGLVSKGVALIASNLGALAAIVFLFVPYFYGRRHGEDLYDYGFRTAPIKQGLLFGLGIPLVVFPIFAVGFVVFYEVVCSIDAIRAVAPPGMCGRFGGLEELHLPPLSFATLEFFFIQVVAVALPEELFFRGFVHQLLERALPSKRTLWGGKIGWALVASSALFAVGHLMVTPDARRLAVFFPGFLFGWVYSKTRSIMAGTIIHALSNVFIYLLERSF